MKKNLSIEEIDTTDYETLKGVLSNCHLYEKETIILSYLEMVYRGYELNQMTGDNQESLNQFCKENQKTKVDELVKIFLKENNVKSYEQYLGINGFEEFAEASIAVKVISLLLNLIIFVVIFFIVMFIGIILSIAIGAPMKEPASLQFYILMYIAIGLSIYFTRKLKVSKFIKKMFTKAP